MGQFIDETGHVYGYLTVLERGPSYKTKGGSISARWRCRCKCGAETLVHGSALRSTSKPTRSCGCWAKQCLANWQSQRLDGTNSNANAQFSNYKASARDRGIDFELTRVQVIDLFQQNCYYCGKAPAQKAKRAGTTCLTFLYNGIDRLDSTVGYKLGNVVAACGRCNKMKATYSESDFMNHIKTIYEFKGLRVVDAFESADESDNGN